MGMLGYWRVFVKWSSGFIGKMEDWLVIFHSFKAGSVGLASDGVALC